MTTALDRESVERVGALVRAPDDGPHTPRGRVLELVEVAPVALVRFACGCVAYVPLRRLAPDLAPAMPACEVAGCSNPRWDGPYCPSHRDTRPASGPASTNGESFEPSAGLTSRASHPHADSGCAIDDVGTTTASAVDGTPAQAPRRGPQAPSGKTAAGGATPPPAPRADRDGRAVREGAATRAAGAAPNRRPTGAGRFIWSRAMVIDAMKAWAAEHGHAPSTGDWSHACPNRTHPSFATTIRVFGTWLEGIRAAGLEPVAAGRRRRWTRETIIAALKGHQAEHGRPPRSAEWSHAAADPTSRPQIAAVRATFGSWGAALEAAGLGPDR
ncbi:homing endonuclease associated repeat-containing protein [Miltoncostaea oceani]|uniref:homing endonuclease associated repeat-containing protein n=1 Tax=Miltoncostaea oceani TaxID=2843216 RepID=UPI001C3D9269|nr:hypothetical protein [Miltoncostaea oceani]